MLPRAVKGHDRGAGLGGFSTAVNPTRLQSVADLMLEFGYLKTKYDINTILAPGVS